MRVVIIGGGAAGVLAAIALYRHGPPAIESVCVVEPRAALGEGVAYSTNDPAHLVNIPALMMSALEDDQQHFARYLDRRGLGSQLTFAPRSTYAAYLRWTLAQVARGSSASFEHVQATATDVALKPDGRLRVELDACEDLDADRVVLCVGHGRPNMPDGPIPERVLDPYAGSLSAGLEDIDYEAASVAILGSGLSAADAAVSLAARGVARIDVVSPSGRFPASHLVQPKWPATGPTIEAIAAERTATGVIRRTRQALHDAAEDWRCVIDGLRPLLPGLWTQLPASERGRLARHVLPIWEKLRHRMPPETGSAVGRLVETGQLRLLRGKASISHAGDVLVDDGGEVGITVAAAAVVPCMGWSRRPEDAGHGLVARLLARGYAQISEGALINTRGGVEGPLEGRLFVTGRLTNAAPWENFAISTLRRQTDAIADALARTGPGFVDAR